MFYNNNFNNFVVAYQLSKNIYKYKNEKRQSVVQ